MASISNDAGGRRRIQFVAADGKRKAIRLGKVTVKQAESFRVWVDRLVSASMLGSAPDAETSRWVAGLADDTHAKLSAVGLVTPRDRAHLSGFIDAYIESRHETKPRTQILYRETRNNLCEFFGGSKSLRDVTMGDADEFRLFLLRKGLGENTVRRRLGRAKQFFKAAVRKRIIEANPFADQKCAVGSSDESRMRFITRAEAASVLEACPNHEWRLIFALARFGGLRTPSETLFLRWIDIDWANNWMTVRSPKTEHLDGKGARRVPIFPELRPYLDDAFDQAADGAEFVIDRYQGHTNLGVSFRKIIARAGLTPWPKTFQNLRSTRETELAKEYPMHVVCAWIGNSQPVAAKHYLQVTDDDFRNAAQNRAQHTSADDSGALHRVNTAQEKTPEMPGYAMAGEAMQCTTVPPLGLEPRTY